MYDHMLIDARNAIYRAIYAGLSDRAFLASGNDSAVILFRFISSYLSKHKSRAIHYFWDAPKEKIWRRAIYKEYKDGRDNSHGGKYDKYDIDEMLSRTCTILKEIADVTNSRNYMMDRQEADDLIFAFCRQNANDKIIIISSDGDFKQIPFLFRNIDIFNPLSKSGSILPKEEVDPVEVKAFSGEKSDNIDGYYGIGPVKATALATSYKKRQAFFETHGRKTFLRNRALIDLSLCPYLLKNMNYVTKIMSKDTYYCEEKIRNIIQKYKIRGLSGEITKSLLTFKFLS